MVKRKRALKSVENERKTTKWTFHFQKKHMACSMLNNNKKKTNKLTHSFIHTHTNSIHIIIAQIATWLIDNSGLECSIVSNLSNAKAPPIKKNNHTHIMEGWKKDRRKIGMEYGI